MSNDQYAVMGNPIGHSKSPRIHSMFADQTTQAMEYRAILVDPDGFSDAVLEFGESGGCGLNVTVPFKQQAFEMATTLSRRAEQAGAVNTLIFRADGALHGDNTDGLGMIRDISVNHGIPIAAKRVLVLGAGGAVRGVLGPLIEQNPTNIHIANRTALKADELADQFHEFADGHDVRLSASGFKDIPKPAFDIIINGTAAGLSDQSPPIDAALLAEGCCCYDMMYSDKPTAFVRWSLEHGAVSALDGLGMLVEQAAESFELWRGVRPDTKAVINALRPGA
ncbi:MAG: shikimate dehydrogenase [Gammaproteobacteria bacterium]